MTRFLTRAALAVSCVTTPAFGPAFGKTTQVALGAQIYASKCSLCHDNSQHMVNDIGPALFGVVDRRVGSVEGFLYTPALRDAYDRGDTWTPAALNKFLTNPSHVRPGTGMPYMIPNAKQRAGVIAYLKTLHEKP